MSLLTLASEESVVGVPTLLALITFLGLCIISLAKIGYTHHLSVADKLDECEKGHLEGAKELGAMKERMATVEGKIEGHKEAREDFKREVRDLGRTLLERMKEE